VSRLCRRWPHRGQKRDAMSRSCLRSPCRGRNRDARRGLDRCGHLWWCASRGRSADPTAPDEARGSRFTAKARRTRRWREGRALRGSVDDALGRSRATAVTGCEAERVAGGSSSALQRESAPVLGPIFADLRALRVFAVRRGSPPRGADRSGRGVRPDRRVIRAPPSPGHRCPFGPRRGARHGREGCHDRSPGPATTRCPASPSGAASSQRECPRRLPRRAGLPKSTTGPSVPDLSKESSPISTTDRSVRHIGKASVRQPDTARAGGWYDLQVMEEVREPSRGRRRRSRGGGPRRGTSRGPAGRPASARTSASG
jgi:hypothetical protein